MTHFLEKWNGKINRFSFCLLDGFEKEQQIVVLHNKYKRKEALLFIWMS